MGCGSLYHIDLYHLSHAILKGVSVGGGGGREMTSGYSSMGTLGIKLFCGSQGLDSGRHRDKALDGNWEF